MKHRYKKVKFGGGLDASRMVMRKLVYNFIRNGKMVTTEKRAKALKTHLETIVHKSKEETDANKNYLLRKLGSPSVVKTLYTQIAPVAKSKTSGFVTLRKMHARLSDGASMVEIRWSIPVVMEEKKAEVVPLPSGEVAQAEVKAKSTTRKVTKTK